MLKKLLELQLLKWSLPTLESFLSNLAAPVAIVDEQGVAQFASPDGEILYTALWSSTQSEFELTVLQETIIPLGRLLIQKALTVIYPSWICVHAAHTAFASKTNCLLKISPLVQDGKSMAMLEWFPEQAGEQSGEEKLRILQEASRAVNSSLILEDIFEALGVVLQDHIPHAEAVIVILDNSQNAIKIMVRISEDGDLDIRGEHHTFAGSDPLVDHLLRQPFSHLYVQNDLPSSVLIAEGSASALVAPLINKGVVIGIIAMSSPLSGHFSSHQAELLAEVSDQLAVAVENAKFYWQTQAQASREFLINQLTRSIRQSLDIDIILDTAVTELGKVIGVSRCFIRYFPPDGEEKTFHYQLPGTQRLNPEELASEKALFGMRKEQTLNPFILNDVRDCPPHWSMQGYLQDSGIKSLAIFPIMIREELAGTLTLHQCDAYRSWVIEDIELLRSLSEHLGVALYQARLFLELDRRKRILEQTLEELQQAQIHLIQSEKMAVLGQFVAGIAHEVNTPLGTMISNNATLTVCVEKLKQAMLPDTDRQPEVSSLENKASTANSLPNAALFSTVDSLLSLNRLASSRIQDIVKNLRNFARLDESELKTVDLCEGIDSTILLIQSSIHPAIAIVREYDASVPPVQCFPGLLNQVFMNLLVNAAHALQERKQQEHLQAEPADERPYQITIKTACVPQTGMFSVIIEDTGRGIALENLTKVFDPGFTTKGAGVGTGLGLALCYRIVEKHQGKISLESKVDQGTRFRVEVPVSHPQKSIQPDSPSA